MTPERLAEIKTLAREGPRSRNSVTILELAEVIERCNMVPDDVEVKYAALCVLNMAGFMDLVGRKEEAATLRVVANRALSTVAP